jgi:hypothetical protein
VQPWARHPYLVGHSKECELSHIARDLFAGGYPLRNPAALYAIIRSARCEVNGSLTSPPALGGPHAVARCGADVVGVDIAEGLLAAARDIAREQGFAIDY